jgi:hypothetical protein
VGLKRALAVVLLAAPLLAGCGGGGGGGAGVDPQVARLHTAERAVDARPDDPRALAALIRTAHAVMQSRTDKQLGVVDPDAAPLLEPAAAAWRRYLELTGYRGDPSVAELASAILDRGLNRAADAAHAMMVAATVRPSSAAYFRVMDLYVRAGNIQQGRLAGRKAVELAKPGERRRLRRAVREYLSTAP